MREKIFISYSREDAAFASSLHKSLSHYEVIYDSISLRSGENFIHQLNKFLDESDYLIVLWSTESVNSEWVLSEVHKAQSIDIGILPIIIENCIIPCPFNLFQSITYPDNYNRTHSMSAYLSYRFLSEVNSSLKKIKIEKKQKELILKKEKEEEMRKANMKRARIRRDMERRKRDMDKKNLLIIFIIIILLLISYKVFGGDIYEFILILISRFSS